MHGRGFSYVEVLMGIVLMAAALVPIINSLALPWAASSEAGYLILNTAREKMEGILALDFSAVPVGTALTDAVTIDGKSYTRSVTVALYDIDGDTVAETNVKKITVQVEETRLEALKVAP